MSLPQAYATWLVVGLGNPGNEYASHRHNIGFRIVDELARRMGVAGDFRAKLGGHLAAGEIRGQRVRLLKPMQYMNLSGDVAQKVSHFFVIPPGQIIVAYDELDLPFGKLKLKRGGGAAGHNGIRSLIACLPSSDFIRVRFGIGKGHGGVGHVLSDFSKAERAELDGLIAQAADAIELIMAEGPTSAMNRYNVRAKPEPGVP